MQERVSRKVLFLKIFGIRFAASMNFYVTESSKLKVKKNGVSLSAILPGVLVEAQKHPLANWQLVALQKVSHPTSSQVFKHFFPEQNNSAVFILFSNIIKNIIILKKFHY